MTDIAPLVSGSSGALAPASEAARRFQGKAMAENTRRAYASDWARFTGWCVSRGLTALPARPETVASYLAAAADLRDEAGNPVYRPATISRWLVAIGHAHFLAGHPKPGSHPQVQTTLAGIRRELGAVPRRMRPLLLADLRRVLAAIDTTTWPEGLAGVRDYALLLAGFAGAFRRSELAALTVGDLTWHPQDGLHILIRRSKTDQEGEGTVTALPYGTYPETCPPCALTRWVRQLAVADAPRAERMRAVFDERDGHICREPRPTLADDAPLFRPVIQSVIGERHISPFVVRDVVRRRLREAGIPADRYAAHSLRAGFVTEALRAGRTHHEVMRQTHHRSTAMVEVYARENDPLRGNAVTGLGL